VNQVHDLAAIASNFEIDGEFRCAKPHGSGHINDSWCVEFRPSGTASAPARYLLQRINHSIFKNIPALMENVQRVTTHLADKLAGEPDSGPDAARRSLTLIPTRDGQPWLQTEDGNHWRAYRFIERSSSFDTVTTPHQAFQAAQAFGQFQLELADLAHPRLHETIPGFHHTPSRLAALQRVIEADPSNRAGQAHSEIAFALARAQIAGVLIDANLPERVTHNDTKFNNLLLDSSTGEAICVIDLDTVMPGLALYDFGDMVRTATSGAAEDEPNLSKVDLHFPIFEALTRGYLSSAGAFLTGQEKDHLVVSGKVIAYEQGLRFLTDHLMGDPYYKIHRPGHNLDRCRTQFKLVESIEAQEDAMNRLVRDLI
jgi:hypothetical protein